VANEIVIKVKLDQDGSFKLVEQQAKKAAKATDDLGKSRNRYNKGEKGVAGATANGTKAFSKMRDSMTGSTGLVSAYAVLASNVFAATAAFNAFSRAAQVSQLEKGLIAVGAAAGQNLPDVAQGLRNITGEALSAEQAMRATALASASGFRSDQLNNLAKVAKGASLALGRDMSDALDRLVRGTAKVEPEILDELGIFVRLDEAVRIYADRLGVAETSLTQYERSQAFLNATIEQGLKKYEDLSQQIDPNPYDKLSAALQNLQKNVLGFVNGFLGLGDMVGFASRNLLSLTAVATTLGGAVTSSVAPGLLRMADASRENAEASFDAHTATAKQLTTAGKLPKKFTALIDKLEDGTATTAEYKEANLSLVRSYAGVSGQISRQENEISKSGVATEAQTKSLSKLREQQEEYGNRLTQLKDIQASQRMASIESSRASAVQNAANLNLFASFKDLGQAHTEDIERTTEATKGKKGLGKTIKGLGPAARTAAGGVKVLGTAFFTALPYIGLIISGISILYGIIKEKFFPEDIVQKRIDDAVKSFENFAEITAAFDRNTSEGGQRLGESYIAIAGILDQIRGKIQDVVTANVSDLGKTMRDETKEVEKQIALQEEKALQLEGMQKSQNRVRGQALLISQIENQIAQSKQKQAYLEANLANAQSRRGEAEKKAANEILSGALLEFEVQMKLNKATKANAFNTKLTSETYGKLVALQKQLDAGELDFTDFLVQLELIQRFPNEIRNSFQNLNTTVAEFNGIMSKRQQKAKVLFDQEEEGAQAILDKFEAVSKKAQETERVPPSILNGFKAFQKATPAAEEARAALEELEKQLENLRIPEEFKTGLPGLQAFVDKIQDSRDAINTLTVSLSQQKEALKALESNMKGVGGAQVILGEERNKMLETEASLIERQIQAEKDLFVASDPTLSAEAKQAEFEAQDHIVKLRAQEVANAEKVVNIKVAEKQAALDVLKVQEQQNRLSAERVKNDLRILKVQQQLSGGQVTKAEAFQQEVAAAEAALAAAQAELVVTSMRLEIEYEILRLKFLEDEVISGAEQKVLDLLLQQQAVVKATAAEKVRGAQIGVTEAIAGGVASQTTPVFSGARGMTSDATATRDAAMTGADNVAAAAVQQQAAQDNLDSGMFNTLAEVQAAEAAVLQAQKNTKSASIAMIAGVVDAQAQALAKLGPEGELAASFATFSADLMVNLDNFANAAEGSAERTAAAFQAAAAAIAGIAQIMAAKSKAQIAEVDNQIAAEKRRDGKSKESVAKISAMEKRKEQLQRKAFEQNKKMQMATVVANTAMSIAANMAAASIAATQAGLAAPAVFAGYLGLMNGITLAMGAAQLAVIAGTSYQGGGSIGGGGAAPSSSVSIGERRKNVDLAKSQSARGELAYFRGESGQGGPESFRSAFGGYRNRAEGGNTAFMVGEQGPELFVPEVPGTIVANDDVQAGAPTNVSFNINTVDASGVEDLLVAQRGNIIGMIRQAANSYGQDFVEEVDTSVFNETTSGVSRY